VRTFLKSLVTLYASNIARSMDFYGRMLGMEETYRFPRTGAAEHVEYGVCGATIAVSSADGVRSHGLPPATPGHPFEIGLKTDDVDALVAELRVAGVAVLLEPRDSPAGNRYAYISDPDGNWISLYQNL
jgi:lactoylglutathione lyase